MKSIIRDFKETDRDYITRTLLKSFLYGSKEAQRINTEAYYQAHNRTINKILDFHDCLIVADKDDNDLIYGFAIYKANQGATDILHYIAVRKDFRGNGIARTMLEHIKAGSKNKTLALSHLTDDFKPARLQAIWEKVIYDPYARLIY